MLMLRTPPERSRSKNPLSTADEDLAVHSGTEELRRSRRVQQLPPEFGHLHLPVRQSTNATSTMANASPAQVILHQPRKPPSFRVTAF
ncbi:hypothetical protein HPB50_004328 [Hyalomma asiaticum]|uniref:Uncharacterized protein n=1 Tax=Hyalomma asiaticum TaxID=266040 RepID=A0ACB7SM85_HYAAI|nr:hypothetical protein HPB50_004328 [Hyalomma asiaticum]